MLNIPKPRQMEKHYIKKVKTGDKRRRWDQYSFPDKITYQNKLTEIFNSEELILRSWIKIGRSICFLSVTIKSLHELQIIPMRQLAFLNTIFFEYSKIILKLICFKVFDVDDKELKIQNHIMKWALSS